MPPRPPLRPGGRSARVQAAVHQATRELIELQGRDALTVPLIAARAGVTPSTIYRRWGDLAELLADVSVERMRPEGEPADTGSFRGDLIAWAEQFHEEMSSEVGRAMLRDVVASAGQGEAAGPCQCAQFTAGVVSALVERGALRGEPVPTVEEVMDGLVAPLVYRLLFGMTPASAEQFAAWAAACAPSDTASSARIR
jgi:AcrR family transcriptional regulator